MKKCKRCGKPYKPKWLGSLKKWCSCCDPCSFRNLMDGLDLPTPPILLDKYTKHPTLTTDEYWKSIDTNANNS